MDSPETQQSMPKRNSNTKSVVMTIIVMIVLFVLLGSWYNNTHYNSTFQDHFMNSCESNGGTVAGCSCAYSVLQNQYTYDQAKDIDTNPSSPNTQAWATSVYSQCR
jgi:DNA-binding transcriptional regulator of glucitol operon